MLRILRDSRSVLLSVGLLVTCARSMAAASDPAADPHPSPMGTPLLQALLEAGRRGGVQVYVERGLEASLRQDVVTATFEGATVEESLRRMLRGRNCIFVYAANTLVEARVYSQGTGQLELLTGPVREHPAAAPKRLSNEGDAEPPRSSRAQLEVEAVRGATAEARIRALEELSEITDEAFVRSATVAVLERDDDPQVLGTAMEVLGQLKAPPVGPVLELLGRTSDFGTRILALEYLAGHGAKDPQVRKAIERAIQSDESADVRNTARLALGTLKGSEPAR